MVQAETAGRAFSALGAVGRGTLQHGGAGFQSDCAPVGWAFWMPRKRMNHKMIGASFSVALGLALALGGAGSAFGQQKPAAAGQQDNLAALKQLRDNGVLTEAEYEAKVKALKAGSAASGSAAGSASAAASSGKGVKFVLGSTRVVDVIDPSYSMTALTLEIPADWKFVGTVARPGGCHGYGASLDYTAESPDGRYAFELLPMVSWSADANANSGAGANANRTAGSKSCQPVNIQTASEFLVNIAIPNLHPGAHIVSVDAPPGDAKASLDAQNAKFRQQGAKQVMDGAIVRIQYVRDGQAFEEMLGATISCIESQMGFGAAAHTHKNCASFGTSIVRAPQGGLDNFLAVMMNLEKDHHPNNDWFMRTISERTAQNQAFINASNARFQQNLRDNQAAYDARFKSIEQQNAARQASTNASMAAAAANQNAIDNAAHQSVNYSLDRRDFINPSTGETITASSEYNHQWMSSDGSTLIQTDDHGYDPNGQVYINQSWTELVPK
jgi:hypothetical protein